MNTLSRRLTKLEAAPATQAGYIGGWHDLGKGWIISGVVVAAEGEEPPTIYKGREVIWGAWMSGENEQ
ncbi:MAG: hypothetical protein ACM33T_16035 [Solirubrobacterales bacterium]